MSSPFRSSRSVKDYFYLDFIKVLDNGTSAPCGVQWGIIKNGLERLEGGA